MAMSRAELMLMHSCDGIDDEEFLLLSTIPTRSRPQVPPGGPKFSLLAQSDDQCFPCSGEEEFGLMSHSSLFHSYGDSQFGWWRKAEYPKRTTALRFSQVDVQRLTNLFHIPEKIVCSNGTVAKAVEALCIFLRRLTYPNRLADLTTLFGRSESEMSVICKEVLNHLYENFGHLIQDLNRSPWVTPDKLRIYADALHAKGAPLQDVWGFVDGTARPICRPKSDQRVAFSGHKRFHCLKFQSIVVPNGLIVSLLGPYEGRRHDAGILGESGLLGQVRALMNDANGEPFSLYGDPAYPLCAHLITGFKAAYLTPQEKAFNQDMSSLRTCVEWVFGKIVQNFAFLDFKKNNKLHLQPVGKLYLVGALLSNCHTCLYGSQTGVYFNLDPPTLEEYLH